MSERKIIVGDCREVLKTLPAQSAQTCITSPPYWGLRDYGMPDQIGQEQSPVEYVATMVAVFREVKRVLKDDGTLWLNLGDSYAKGTNGGYSAKSTLSGFTSTNTKGRLANETGARRRLSCGVKHKDLVGIPWMVAFALREDGWFLRSDIIWAKPNPMPESVTDRPTKAHEYVFLLAKSSDYLFDAAAIQEDAKTGAGVKPNKYALHVQSGGRDTQRLGGARADGKRNKRSVWTVTPKPFKGAHFATMPPGLVEPCVLAGSRPGDVVLDPFSGAGTTALVACKHDRSFVGIELNPNYAELSEQRLAAGVK